MSLSRWYAARHAAAVSTHGRVAATLRIMLRAFMAPPPSVRMAPIMGDGAFGTGSGTYKIKGKTIETYVGGELYLKYNVKEMTGTTAELTIIDGDDTLDVKIRKTK